MDNEKLFYAFSVIFILLSVCFVSGAITTTLISPADNSWNLSNSVQFTFRCVGNYSAYNTTLYVNGAYNSAFGNASGTALNNTETNTTIVTLADATSYLWNIECWGNGSRDGILSRTQAAANFTLKVDTTNPGGSITMPRTTTIFVQNLIKLKCSGSDTTAGVNYVKLKITKPSKKVLEYNLGSGKEKILRGIDTGEAGKYYVDCTIYDNVNKTYNTEQKSFNTYYRSGKAAAPEEEPEEEITPEGEEAEGVPTEGVPTEKAPSKAWIWILVIVVIILILYFVLKKKK